MARAISAGRVEMPSDGETAINIGFSATNPIGKKSCGTWTGTFGLEKLLKAEGHMPEDRFLVMSRKGRRLGVAFASTPRGEGGARSLKFKIE